MREPSIYYLQNIHWKELEKEITANGEQSLDDQVAIVPVRDPEFKHYIVISLSPATDQVLDALQGTRLENIGLKDKLAGMPVTPVYGKGELMDLLK
jgi:hypothetical protein